MTSRSRRCSSQPPPCRFLGSVAEQEKCDLITPDSDIEAVIYSDAHLGRKHWKALVTVFANLFPPRCCGTTILNANGAGSAQAHRHDHAHSVPHRRSSPAGPIPRGSGVPNKLNIETSKLPFLSLGLGRLQHDARRHFSFHFI
jgi:hypothetical protein